MDSTPINVHRLLTEAFILLDDADRRTLAPFKLSIRQFYILHHLGETDGLSINALSTRLLCDKSNTTRLVERMRQDGLLCRRQDPKDRRYVKISLTEKGEALRQKVMETHHANIIAELRVFSPTELATLETLLGRLRKKLLVQLNYSDPSAD